jgi:AcrR family transcriptional regulator
MALRKTRTPEDTAVRRARILDIAIAVIGERGYYGFTLQELAQRCGLSNPGLLHYFPSKLDLFKTVLEELESREVAHMRPLIQAAAARAGGIEARSAVLDILRTIVARDSERPHVIRLVAELGLETLDSSHPAYAWWSSKASIARTFIEKLIGPYVDEPASRARQVMAMSSGLEVYWLRSGRSFDIVAEWDSALARLLPELVSARAEDRP